MNGARVCKELQESALGEFPNPERNGCSDSATLSSVNNLLPDCKKRPKQGEQCVMWRSWSGIICITLTGESLRFESLRRPVLHPPF